ncbi:MAG: phosphate uptake regulator PhoU [Nitrososphaera sp.]|nr:phosphate uptake regulator PhoU [Nitrososphaera sp.]
MRTGADHREVRKVQFTGRSTYVLSLPKKWIEEMHVRAGDQVTLVRELDNSLSVIPIAIEKSEALSEVTAILSPNEGSDTLKRKVVSMYLAGYNIVHLKLKSGRIHPALRDAVREVVRRNLVGTEMIADASDSITLQVLLSLPELSVSTAIRRMYLIASSMHKDSISALAELNHEMAKEVLKSDDEVDRFSLYILRNLVMATQNGRVLREMGLKNPSDCLSYRVAVKSIERVADHACGIAERADKLKDKIPKDSIQKIERMSHLALTVLADSVEALLRRDYHLADKTVDTAETIRPLENEALAAIEKDRIHDPANLKLVLENIRRTAEYASDIAEAALNETIDEVIEKHSASHIVLTASSNL